MDIEIMPREHASELLPREPASERLHRIAQVIMELAINVEKFERMGFPAVHMTVDVVVHNEVSHLQSAIPVTEVRITSTVRITVGK